MRFFQTAARVQGFRKVSLRNFQVLGLHMWDRKWKASGVGQMPAVDRMRAVAWPRPVAVSPQDNRSWMDSMSSDPSGAFVPLTQSDECDAHLLEHPHHTNLLLNVL